MEKVDVMDLIFGLNKIRDLLEKADYNLHPNLITIGIPFFNGNTGYIYVAIKYLELASGKDQIVFSVAEDRDNSIIYLQVSVHNIKNAIDLFKELYSTKIYDGRTTNKEIECISLDHFKRITDVVLTLCKFGLYSGYSYDYVTQRLTVFV